MTIPASIRPASLLSQRLRSLTLAITVAAAALAGPAALAHAEPADPGVRCAAQVGPGQYEFFLPGDRAVDKDGNKWVCGPDGKWFRDYSALQLTPVTTRSPFTRVAVNWVVAPAVAR